MAGEAPPLKEVHREAVTAAEASVDQKALGPLKDVIDSNEEIRAFFHKAYDKIKGYVKATNDPRLEEKLAALEKKYQEATAVTKDYYIREEEMADDYWQELVLIVEKDEREKIQHGPDLQTQIGLPTSAKVLHYKKDAEENHCYILENKYLRYDLKWKPDGIIELEMDVDEDEWINFYESFTRRFGMDQIFKISKKVSLADLRDGSAFELHLAPFEDWNLTDPLRELLDDTLADVPKRSTKPEFAPLIAMRSEIENLRNEIRAKTLNRRELTPEENKAFQEKVGLVFCKRLRQFYELPRKDTEEAQRLAARLKNILRKYTPLLDSALSEVKNRGELDNFGIFEFDEYDRPYHQAKIKQRRDELTEKSDEEKALEKIPVYKKLSTVHKKTYLDLKAHGVKIPASANFFRDFGRLKPEVLGDYQKFILDHPSIFEPEENIILFTREAAQLNRLQFGYYEEFCEKSIYGSKLKGVNKIFRAYEAREDLQFLPLLLFSAGINDPKEIKKNIQRVRNLVKDKKIEPDTLLGKMKEVGMTMAPYVITCFEELDNYREDYIDIIMKNLPSYSMKAADFKRLNALKPFQQRGLYYLSQGDFKLQIFSQAELDQFLLTLSNVKTETEMRYILEMAPRHVINPKAKSPYAANIWLSQASIEGLEKTRAEAAKHADLWNEIEKRQQQTPGLQLGEDAYKTIGVLLERNIPEAVILDNIKSLVAIVTDVQLKTIEILLTPENVGDLLKTMAGCQEKCTEISFSSGIKKIYYKMMNDRPPLNVIIRLVDVLVAVANDYNNLRELGIHSVMAGKVANVQQFLDVVAALEKPEFISAVHDLRKNPYENLAKLGSINVDYIVTNYFFLAVSPEDFKKPQDILDGLGVYIRKADKTNYDYKTDPGLEKASALLDTQKILAKSDASYTHIAFIINILQDCAPQFSKEKLKEFGKKQLDSADAKLQEKGAKILIGLGSDAQEFDEKTLKKIAAVGVDGKLTKYTISDNIRPAQIAYLHKPENGQVPLSLYFSWLMNLEGVDDAANQVNFENLVQDYKALENQPVYEGKLLALTHNTADENHSYLFANDTFNPEAHSIFAGEIQKLPVEILRHGEHDESVESMFSTIEETTGNATVLIGGHGSPGYITFGGEGFYMQRLFESFAKRLAREPEGQKWSTTIIFDSCHSDYNIEKLMKLWNEDPHTKDQPVKMLSSSGENQSSAKMTGDSWLLKAKKSKSQGTVLTWKELYHDIESRTFIMSENGLNSNMTLYVNGKKLG